MKRAFLLSLFLLPSFCFAEEALLEANKNFNQSIATLSAKEEACKASASTLPARIFAGLDLNKDEIRVALQYHYLKTMTDCSDAELKDYLLSSAVLASIELEKADELAQGNQLIVNNRVLLLKAATAYEKLRPELRNTLEKLPNLRKPFLLIESSAAVGL